MTILLVATLYKSGRAERVLKKGFYAILFRILENNIRKICECQKQSVPLHVKELELWH